MSRKVNTEELVISCITLVLVLMTVHIGLLRHRVAQLEEYLSDTQKAVIQLQEEQIEQATTENELLGQLAQEVEEIRSRLATKTAAGAVTIPDREPPAEETGNRNTPCAPDYVLRVLTAEAGDDPVLCGCVAQCMFNACAKAGWEYPVEEILEQYSYTDPADWISESAVRAYDEVFCSGVTYTDVGEALYFYAPAYCESEWHESLQFVAEVSGVRFFAEVGR